jgi:hypothetical protein
MISEVGKGWDIGEFSEIQFSADSEKRCLNGRVTGNERGADFGIWNGGLVASRYGGWRALEKGKPLL